LGIGVFSDQEEECVKRNTSPGEGIRDQFEDRYDLCGHENPSGRGLPLVWIIQPRIDSMIEVVELLVNGMGENC